MMYRNEAIRHILANAERLAELTATSHRVIDEMRNEAVESLTALGVTEHEIDRALGVAE